MIPILLMGGLVIILMQTFSGPSKGPTHTLDPSQKPVSGQQPKNDFAFPKAADGEKSTVDTEHAVVQLSSKGGRITRLYVRSHDKVTIPDSVIKKANDPVGTQSKAIELTRGNGLDFQPHLYFRDDAQTSGGYQLSEPPLNEGAFQGTVRKDPKSGITEARYRIPVRLKDHDLEVTKIYRFLPHESFFHQITIIRNVEKKEFVLGGDLLFKPFGDIGPPPIPHDDRDAGMFGRFYAHGGSLNQRVNLPPSNSLLAPIGCGERHADLPHSIVEPEKGKNTLLDLVGVNSRYTFGYARFLGPENSMHLPTGLILKNQIDPAGKEALTTFFRSFKLSPSTGDVDLGDASGNVDADGKIKPQGNSAKIKLAQSRSDLLVIDSTVFFGVKSDEGHSFSNAALVAAEMGITTPDALARKVIYSSPLLSVFSGVRDGIVWVMRFTYTYIGNYGWVIILIAVLFKLLTFPLNQMQAKSMKKMSALKPEMDKINEKYAENPQEKQKRIMELYKKHNINPAKGCLPILIQMPIFIALYSAFSESIELWHSPFILWMTDLSTPDTVYIIKELFVTQNFHINILPLVMVGSQILQQRLTQVAADPQQKMLMYMMPFIMLIFFWSIPSGVTLYWTVQNILAVLWQLGVNTFGKDEAAKAKK